jgi:hypothetical protein
VRWSPVNEDVNTDAEEATLLEAVTMQQPPKRQQNEKVPYVL